MEDDRSREFNILFDEEMARVRAEEEEHLRKLEAKRKLRAQQEAMEYGPGPAGANGAGAGVNGAGANGAGAGANGAGPNGAGANGAGAEAATESQGTAGSQAGAEEEAVPDSPTETEDPSTRHNSRPGTRGSS